ncbi:MAG: PAS domain S-box protein [Lachnospiraceae bacterium]|nr:PAS domain S-box protein [Lachnospiraceae bacterium]
MENEFHFNKQEKKFLKEFPGMLVIFQVLDGMDKVVLASDQMLAELNLTFPELQIYFVNGYKPVVRYTSPEGETRVFMGKETSQKRKHCVLRYVTYADVTGLFLRLDKYDQMEGDLHSDSFYKEILDSIDVGVFWKDEKGRFTGVNRAFLETYGFEKEEDVVGKTDEDMGWHSSPEVFAGEEEKVLSGQKSTLVTTKNLIQGRERDIAASKAPLYDKNGNVCGLVGSFVDITPLM